MKVTQVEPQKKNPRRFNVYLDGNFAFGADEDLIVNFRLLIDKEVSPTDLEKILFEAEVGKLMERMYGLLGRRMRSEKEIRDYLKNLSFKRKIRDDEEISLVTANSLIEKLKNKGLVNDLEFAKAWVESRRKNKNRGKIALKQELYQKGIDKEIIEEVLSDEVRDQSSEVSEEQLANNALEKKLKSWKSLSSQEFKKKAYEFLMRRGFEYSVVKEVVENQLKKE